MRHSDLVKKAISQTNSNMFYINRNCVGSKVSIKVDHCHDKETEDWAR